MRAITKRLLSILICFSLILFVSWLARAQKNRRPRRPAAQRNQQNKKVNNALLVHAELRPGAPLELPASALVQTDEKDDTVVRSRRRHRRQDHNKEGGIPNDDPHHPGGGGSGGRPTPRATVFKPIEQTKMRLGHDPQIAVGKDYVVATTTGSIVFFNKSGDQLTEKRSGGSIGGFPLKTRMKTNDFFAPLMAPFLNGPDGKPDHNKPNPNDVNRHIFTHFDSIFLKPYRSMACHPDDPTEVGCVNTAYDTRVVYDKQRGVFWIEAALRDPVWVDSDCDKNACAPLETGIPHRFIAVAVSKSEDPRDGFNEFVLVDEYGDWPRIAVHGPFLILSHNNKGNIFLFDADKLARNDFNNGQIALGTIYKSELDVDDVYPVLQYDKADETSTNAATIPTFPLPGKSTKVPTFLVGIQGDKVKIYAFDEVVVPQMIGVAFLHPKLMEGSITLDEDVPWPRASPIYRNGKIYLVGDECIEGDDSDCHRQVRLIRIPVSRGNAFLSGAIVPSGSANLGFLDTWIGDRLNEISYGVPAINVNKNGDMLIVFGSAGCCSNPFPPSAAFSVYYHDAPMESITVPLHDAICGLPSNLDCMFAGHVPDAIDVAAVVVDPTDDATMWMTHGFVDGTIPPQLAAPIVLGLTPKYRMVIGKVKP